MVLTVLAIALAAVVSVEAYIFVVVRVVVTGVQTGVFAMALAPIVTILVAVVIELLFLLSTTLGRRQYLVVGMPRGARAPFKERRADTGVGRASSI